MKTLKTYLILAASAAVLAVATPASAGGVTSPVSVIDTLDWSQLGAEGTIVNSPATATTKLGNIVTVSNAAGALMRYDQSSAWTPGNFAPGTALLYTAPFLNPAPIPPASDITLSFATPVLGAGAQIQSSYNGPFTAQITVNGNLHFTENGVSNGNEDGSAIFIGWLGGPIKTLEFTLTSAPSGTVSDFAIGAVQVSPGPVPGAGLAGLAALASAGLFARTRRA